MEVIPRVDPPRPRTAAVTRVRLLKRLDLVFEAGVGLISAGGGYGKSTLLASWIAAHERTVDVVWLTLEPEHDDPRLLAEHLAIASQSVSPSMARADLADVLTSLAPQVTPRQRRVVLVLDDTHRVQSSSIFAALSQLLERRPPRLHVVFSGREDPPLPWGVLRARGELVEVRTHDLAFDDEEARALFVQTFDVALPRQAVERLRVQTHGWITGLCLAGLTLRGADDADAMLEASPDHLRHITEYLERELIQQLPRDVVAFLERTAVVDELDPELCDRLTGRVDSLEVLNDLVARNLFTERVSVEPPRFRYHDLLQERLRSRLQLRDADEADALMRDASRWYEDRRWMNSAIELALRSGDDARATRLIRDSCGPTMSRGYFQTVVRWLEALPDDVVWNRPDLLLVLGRASGLCGDLATAETAVLAASRALAESEEPAPAGLRIGLLQLEGSTRVWAGRLASALEPLEEARALFDEHGDDADPLLRMFDIDAESIWAALALMRLFVGHFDEAIRLSSGVLKPGTIARPTRFTVLAAGVRALAYAWSGDEDAARRAVRQGMRVLQSFEGPDQEAVALHIARAWLGDDPDADHGLAAAFAVADRLDYPFVTAPTLLASARLNLVRGDLARACERLVAADDVIGEMSEPLAFAEIADQLRQQLSPAGADNDSVLSERELEVLAAVARGLTRMQAAAELHLSINTVKTYLRTAYRKLDAHDRAEAVAAARDRGLLAPGHEGDVTPQE